MQHAKPPQDTTLLELLIDGFEKNEVLGGFHMRTLPLPDEATAAGKFAEFIDEVRRWKGEPATGISTPERQLAAWSDMEIRQAGRGVMVRVRQPRFEWWHLAASWADHPMQQIYDWIDEDAVR